MRSSRFAAPVVLAALSLLLVAGCSARKAAVEPAPPVERTAEAPPPEPDRIASVSVEPTRVERGQPVRFTVIGTAGRSARVELTGRDGAAVGTSRTVELAAVGGGRYEAVFSATGALPAGSYRVAAVLEGAPSGQSVTRTADAPLVVVEPAPKLGACEELSRDLAAQTMVYFDFDRSDIRPDAAAWLRSVAARLEAAADDVAELVIEGHCDERGTIEYNLALGARRADAVRDFLAAAGVSVPIRTVSRGEEDPVIPGARTEEEHALNRRAKLRLTCR